MNPRAGPRDPSVASRRSHTLLAFEVIGLAFVALFLAALVTGGEGAAGR